MQHVDLHEQLAAGGAQRPTLAVDGAGDRREVLAGEACARRPRRVWTAEDEARIPNHLANLPKPHYGSEPLVVPHRATPGYEVLVTDSGATAVNLVNQKQIARMVADPEAPAGTWAVKTIFVYPDHVRRGLGTAMLHQYGKHRKLPMVMPDDMTDLGGTFFGSFLTIAEHQAQVLVAGHTTTNPTRSSP